MMTLIFHELRTGRKALLIWSLSIGFLIAVCVFMYPEMKGEMESISDMFGGMGSFTEAFGMDKINFGTLEGFYAIECGNMLGIGGAFFAALIGISSLSKEEGLGTAEFLLTSPIPRWKIVLSKYLAMIIEIVVLNLFVYLLSLVSVLLIHEAIPGKAFFLLHLAFLIMQIELASICFGISAFLGRGNIGIGIGLASVLYFMNIIANLSDHATFLKFFTPFGYAEGADIVSTLSLDGTKILLGILWIILGVVVSLVQYIKKDIH